MVAVRRPDRGRTASCPVIGDKAMTPAETPDTIDATIAADGNNTASPDAPCVASADFVRAVSDFLDTDPADILDELGYYDRRKTTATTPAPATGNAAITFSIMG